MQSQILAPAAVLVVWTLIILLWLVVTRLPAMKKAGIDMGAQPGGRGQNLEGVLPDKANWPSHNYAHLAEQPTIFYAAVFIIALTGTGNVWINVWLAWAYVGLRIVHSLIQLLWNYVPVRFVVFTLATICLLLLSLHALVIAWQFA
ncbi:MAPEG family protein [Parasphingopyxis marina]|uniref:MAPEG family protein n=1 Tax=Parasphingopyxis marina TaxID=2761622 RepID=A0A842HUJ1_9SPHN|nr:MAPEG family protein [Parasphingopyxis marina]MBC2777648.1 MAPEG family protein [Parasphingopyxis marina]